MGEAVVEEDYAPCQVGHEKSDQESKLEPLALAHSIANGRLLTVLLALVGAIT